MRRPDVTQRQSGNCSHLQTERRGYHTSFRALRKILNFEANFKIKFMEIMDAEGFSFIIKGNVVLNYYSFVTFVI